MGPYCLRPFNKPRVKIIAIILCEATVSQLSKQEGEVKEVNHKVCERRMESIKARKVGPTRQMCVKEREMGLKGEKKASIEADPLSEWLVWRQMLQ